MRRIATVLLALWLSASPIAAAGFVGAYVWGGGVAVNSGIQQFYDSVNLQLTLGFDTIRLKIGPGQVSDYSISPDPCASTKTLACYAQVMFASPVWDNAGLKRVMLTSFDFTAYAAASNSNAGYYTASILSANQAAIKAEYAALFDVLKARFGSRNIQFIVSNWEGDNLIYCGDAYGFSKGGSVASACAAQISAAGQTNVSRAQSLLQWFGYKDAAVAAYVAANPGFNLISAPEFNAYSLFASGCGGYCNASTDTVLGQIAAAGGRAYCSYSSYDAQGGPGGAYITAIRAILAGGCSNLIIGEAGYDLNVSSVEADKQLFLALDQIRNVPGVLGVIPWHAVDAAGATTKYGMLSATGARQVINLLGPLTPTPQVPQ